MASIFFLSALDSEILSCAYFSKLVKGDRVLMRVETAIAKSIQVKPRADGDRDFPLTFA
jgi:hypothetical protein